MNKIEKNKISLADLNKIQVKTRQENNRIEKRIDEILSRSLSLTHEEIFEIDNRLSQRINQNDLQAIQKIDAMEVKLLREEVEKLQKFLDSNFYEQKFKWESPFNEIEISLLNVNSKIKNYLNKHEVNNQKEQRLIQNLLIFGKWLDLVYFSKFFIIGNLMSF